MEACVDADEKSEALKYIPKLTDPRERAEVIQISLEQLFLLRMLSFFCNFFEMVHGLCGC